MCDCENTIKKPNQKSKNNVLNFPCKKQNNNSMEMSTFEHHINFLMESTIYDEHCLTHYFLEKALESWRDIRSYI